jgi:Uma2 family endonuclease
MSVEEYLRTSFDGADREYLDGEIVERNVGDLLHSEAQHRLDLELGILGKKLPFHVRPELRVQVAPRRYRIVDLAVFAGPKPTERVPSSPPLVTIEILSPDDAFADVLDKLEDYRKWGVEHVWLVDPRARRLFAYKGAGLSEVAAFEIPEYEVRIPSSEIFE